MTAASKKVILLGVLLCLALASGEAQSRAKEEFSSNSVQGKIVVVRVAEIISPPVAERIKEALSHAVEQRSQALLIVLDTPGGLDLAMRDIVKTILNAPLPVIVFVGPPGARAASAGAIITVSAHISAMAPSTNIGAAHPVGMGITGGNDAVMMQKARNDMVAYAQSIAKMRGKNQRWIKQAIVNSSAITETEAKSLGVIDFVATDVDDLLRKINGATVAVGKSHVTMATLGVQIVDVKPPFRHKVLSAISNPNVAYVLFLLGLAGLYFEFASPGALFPGVVGAISLLVAFFSMQTLPVNFVGIALILLAIVLFFMEIKVVSNGILTVGGIVSLTLGSLMLFDSPDPTLRISVGVLVTAISSLVAFFVAIIILTVKAQRRKKLIGTEEMLGREGIALESFAETGIVLLGGEYWQALSADGVEIPAKTCVVVVGVDGLRLMVKIKN